MVDEKLLTVFLVVTAVAVLIQTGILVGFYVLSAKLSRQADQAMDVTRTFLGPLQSTVESLQSVAARFAEFSSQTQGQVRQFVRPKA
jgi:hypothetical protein